jgi:hypothetical protein
MRFEDWEDLIIAFIILVILIVVGNVLEFGSVTYTTGEINLKDEAGLFLLNYVKSETDSGKIANRIILNEGGDHTIRRPLQELSKELLAFTGFGRRDYLLKAKYPDGKLELIAGSGAYRLPIEQEVSLTLAELEYDNKRTREALQLGDGEKIKLPSLNGGLITVEFKLEDE